MKFFYRTSLFIYLLGTSYAPSFGANAPLLKANSSSLETNASPTNIPVTSLGINSNLSIANASPSTRTATPSESSPISLGKSTNLKAIRSLLHRLAPSVADRFDFEELAGEKKDVFELQTVDNRIVIRGNSANSMAVGLNHYLKYYCNTSVSWYLADPVQLPAILPAVDGKVRIHARMEKRFFLNYCTFGYSMTWWQWPEWERLIDWMALNGVNMPLAITGQESVWHGVWKKLGLEDEEIRNYFTGPAHLPWHRMTNVDYWQGGLPDSWLKHQAELQKMIVERERQLNMTPVLPAFAGHVPQEIKRIYPDAKITRMSSWGGFDEKYRSFFLDPLDPLFAKIQKAFLQEQERLYGTDHIYGADPFNEIDSPSWEPEYLATVSRTIYQTLKQCDPKATWLQMTWLFYFDRKHWTNPRIDAFVNAVPRDKMILLDYFAENTEVWKTTEGYFKQPYLWCYLGNFGGNTMLAGNLREVGKRIENAYAKGGKNFWGIGSTLEALDVNPLMYEYVFEKAWDHQQSDEKWICSWADRRVGLKDDQARAAWTGLLDEVYTATAQLGQGTLTNARPSLKGNGNWTTRPAINYSNQKLFTLWELLLKADNTEKRDSYLFDVVNVGRQVLGNHFLTLRDRFTAAYERKDTVALLSEGLQMNNLLNDMERLLSTHSTFLFGKWVQEAAQFGTTPAEKEYFKKNARTLLTTWGEKGQSLNDYANRSWAGLTAGYYAPRWHAFIQEVWQAFKAGKEFDQKKFNQQMIDFEQSFVDNDYVSSALPHSGGVELARELMEKYRSSVSNTPK